LEALRRYIGGQEDKEKRVGLGGRQEVGQERCDELSEEYGKRASVPAQQVVWRDLLFVQYLMSGRSAMEQ
jgi:hypothetical protein